MQTLAVSALALVGAAACTSGSSSGRASDTRGPTSNLEFDRWSITQGRGECAEVLDGEQAGVLTHKMWCDVAGGALFGTNNLALLGSDEYGAIYLWTDASPDQLALVNIEGAFISDKADLLVVYMREGTEATVRLAGQDQCSLRLLENGTAVADCGSLTPISPVLRLDRDS